MIRKKAFCWVSKKICILTKKNILCLCLIKEEILFLIKSKTILLDQGVGQQDGGFSHSREVDVRPKTLTPGEGVPAP